MVMYLVCSKGRRNEGGRRKEGEWIAKKRWKQQKKSEQVLRAQHAKREGPQSVTPILDHTYYVTENWSGA
jgi:hypothetical protein